MVRPAPSLESESSLLSVKIGAYHIFQGRAALLRTVNRDVWT